MKVLDLGMGVGGPLRNIVKYTEAEVKGITINDYQVDRAKILTKDMSEELKKLMSYEQGD